MKVTVLGLGLMGLPVALRLQQQGFEVVGWNRSRRGVENARFAGLEVVTDLGLALQRSDLIALLLSDTAAIQSVLFPPTQRCELAGRILLQMGTIAPAESRNLAEMTAKQGAHYLEAPVLGSIPEASAGKLIVMAGGDPATFTRCLPVLRALAQDPQRIGAVGQGAALKLAFNQLIATLTTGFAVSLGLVRAEGLDIDQFMNLLRQSALYAATFDKKLPKMLGHDYANPNFPLKHLSKDVELFRRVAAGDGIDFSLPAALLTLFEKAQSKGHGDEDYSSLYEAVNPIEPNRN